MEDVYNMDETGFQMGHTQSEFVVYNSSQGPAIVSASENTNWVSIIECISIQKAIKPYMIFTGKNPETDWFPPNDQLPNFIYAFSEKGWSDDELAIDWLHRIFLQETPKEKHQILILNGHRSHLTGEFQYICYQNNVYLLYLPTNLSYKLQPLDMGPFSPLARKYSRYLRNSLPRAQQY
jgi:DDE superfamily endonuclease